MRDKYYLGEEKTTKAIFEWNRNLYMRLYGQAYVEKFTRSCLLGVVVEHHLLKSGLYV